MGGGTKEWIVGGLLALALLLRVWAWGEAARARAQERPAGGANAPPSATRPAVPPTENLPAPVEVAQLPTAEQQRAARLAGAGLKLGARLPKLELFDRQGRKWDWTARHDKFQVYIGGCITCQVFLDQVDPLEQLAREFRSRPVEFHYVHPRTTHAEVRRLTEAYTLKERLSLGAAMARELGGEIPWLMSGPGPAAAREWKVHQPNFELVVAPTGELLRAREWSDPAELRTDLAELIPPATEGTPPAGLEGKDATGDPGEAAPGKRPQRRSDVKASRGFDPVPLEKPLYMPRLKVEPVVADPEGKYPLKLRAEAQRPLLKGKPGKWFLRFNVDPLYELTWPENDAERRPVVVIVESVGATPRRLARYELAPPPGPQPGAPLGWRAHPLESLAEAPVAQSSIQLRLTATLSDAQGEPVEIEQTWLVRFEELPD